MGLYYLNLQYRIGNQDWVTLSRTEIVSLDQHIETIVAVMNGALEDNWRIILETSFYKR